MIEIITSIKENRKIRRRTQRDPVQGVKVQIARALLATVYADEDGWYQYNYKHTGKAATFTIKLPHHGLKQSVTLKANSFVVVNFQI